MRVRRRLTKGLALTSGAFVFLACEARRATPLSSPPSAASTIVDASAPPPSEESARVRLCTFRGHHGYSGITVAIEASCGERSASCTIASPPMNGVVTDVDVRVELTASSDATCANRGTRVTGTCVLPASSTSDPSGRYPSAHSRLAPGASVVVRANGANVGTFRTDTTGFPDPVEQCWTVEMARAEGR